MGEPEFVEVEVPVATTAEDKHNEFVLLRMPKEDAAQLGTRLLMEADAEPDLAFIDTEYLMKHLANRARCAVIVISIEGHDGGVSEVLRAQHGGVHEQVGLLQEMTQIILTQMAQVRHEQDAV